MFVANRRTLGAMLVCAAAATFLATASAARAGTYRVAACLAGGVNYPNHSWSAFNTSASTLTTGVSCPPASGRYDGIFAYDTLGAPTDTPPNGSAAWQFTAPPGTTISALDYWREIGKYHENSWQVGLTANGGGGTYDSCTIPGLSADCGSGHAPYDITLSAGSIVFPGSPTQLTFGFSCPSDVVTCANGASIHHVFAALYGALVTLNDPNPPGITGAGGTLWTANGYHSGVEPVSFAASDAESGVATMAVSAGSTDLVVDSRPCDYSYPIPCAQSAGSRTYSIDTRSLADGVYKLTLSATDAGGNRTTTSRDIVVDNYPPGEPRNIRVTSGGSAFAVAWDNPPGQGAPIAKAHFQVCNALGPDCGPVSSVGGLNISSIAGIVAAEGSILHVWLEDDAGHADPSTAATLLLISPGAIGEPGGSSGTSGAGGGADGRRRTSPGLSVTSIDEAAGTLAVAGTIAADANGPIHVQTDGRRFRAEHDARRTRGRPGRWHARFAVPRRARGRTTITARFDGDAHHAAGEARATTRVTPPPHRRRHRD